MNESAVAAINEVSEAVNIIIDEELITPVFQPIVSLKNGKILGYEALSRIAEKELEMSIDTLFITAGSMKRLWDLEALCRAKSLSKAAEKPAGAKLFLNVNANVIYDDKFVSGFTRAHSSNYKIESSDIVFEITERIAPSHPKMFFDSINHYKDQRYTIAIDDVGSGFSGLNLIVEAKPNFIKIDMNLVRNIDKDNMKITMCRALVEFCKNADIKLIAEGIETEEELAALIKMGVDYGQGFFIGIPKQKFDKIEDDKIKLISTIHSKKYIANTKTSVYPQIGMLCKKGYTVEPTLMGVALFEKFKSNPTITEVCILEDNKAIGFITRAEIFGAFGGLYGHSINSRKKVKDLMRIDFLKVDYNIKVDEISRVAMQRAYERLYNPVVVEKEGDYLGMVTVKDMLDACTKIQIEIAKHLNPLTGLPGNLLIEDEIFRRIFGETPYCITYYDLDNFKAYNDAYGFVNGDLMLMLLSDVLKTCAKNDEFIGHIGGDDFIVIADHHEGEAFCENVLTMFNSQLVSLYREIDLQNGFIVSKNRHGVTENFPIVTISIAGVTNRNKRYKNIDEFSADVARIKKQCKKQLGNCYHIE
jgi:diguanylate cyclase (GGDEF)-like protein